MRLTAVDVMIAAMTAVAATAWSAKVSGGLWETLLFGIALVAVAATGFLTQAALDERDEHDATENTPERS